jgi:hypothetical protein
MDKPILTEPGVKYFMNEVLKTCNERKSLFTNSIFNLVLFLLFVLVVGGFLYYKYRGKLTPEEKEAKLREQKQDVLARLNALNIKIESTKKGGANMITDLPMWDAPSSQVMVNPYI